MMQQKYVNPNSEYSFYAMSKLGASRPFLEREYGMMTDLDNGSNPGRKLALAWLDNLTLTKQLRYPLVRNRTVAAQIQYRSQLHMEGVSFSMRLKNLLTSGTLAVFVLPERSSLGHNPASMYHEFYYDLMNPGKQYLHVDSIGGGDPLINLTDVEAAQIARAGRNFALSYLDPTQVDLYIVNLLHAYAGLLRFRPSKASSDDFQLLQGAKALYMLQTQR